MPFDEDKFSKYTEWTLYKKCPCCGTENSYVEEYVTDIKRISKDQSFVDAMIKLHDENPIEYELKMQQFRATKQQQKVTEKAVEEKSIPHCPHCNSTSLSKISTMKKATKIGLFGIFGAGDLGKTYKCNNCGCKF